MAAPMSGEKLVLPAQYKAPVWQYFGFKSTKNAANIWETDKSCVFCRKCETKLKFSGNTTNLITHMQRHHQDVSLDKISSERRTLTGISTNSNDCVAKSQPTLPGILGARSKLKYNSLRAKMITTSIGKFIAKDLRPYSVVESSGFVELIKVLEPQYTVPTRKTFSDSIIPELYESTKTDVINQLRGADSVSITTDGWTSIATQSYVTVTAHYLSKEWDLCNNVLQTRVTEESHTGENIAKELLLCFAEWDINGKVFALVTDNASNMKSAANAANIKTHLGCFAHVLNLAAQKAEKVNSISKPLAKIRNVIKYFRKSTTAFAVFKEKQKLLKLPDHKLNIDVVTRWNSTHDMVERYLEQQAAVQAAMLSKDLRIKRDANISALSDSEIVLAEEFVDTLKPLKTATMVLCDEKKPTVSVVWPLLNQIMQNLQANENDSSCVKMLKQALLSDLSGRYTEPYQQHMLQKSSALDPRFKELAFLTDEQKLKVYTNIAIEASEYYNKPFQIKQEPADDTLTQSEPPLPELPTLPDVHNEPQASTSTSTDEIMSTIAEDEADSDNEIPVKKIKTEHSCALDDIFGDVFIFREEVGTKSPIDIANDEVNRYRSCSSLPMKQNPLEWWKSNAIFYPLLACLTRRYLAVPGTSVPSERIFSTAGDIVTAQRSTLKPEHVDKLIFLKKNLK